MARSWLVDSRTIAKKVKSASLSPAYQIKDCGAKRECPNCYHSIDNNGVFPEWPGLPAGVKFDPSEVELLEHLEAKCGIGTSEPHMFLDEFIPTIESSGGICYTHPENLPGAKKDGSILHFFHRTTNAYSSGQRKRRKVCSEYNIEIEGVRWHKTGKTRAVMDNGVHKGWEKIMVLYQSSKKGSKPLKLNWIMHQYHLGAVEEEKDGEYVVCKIFYKQEKHLEKSVDHDKSLSVEDPDVEIIHTSPRTPAANPPNPPRSQEKALNDNVNMEYTPKVAAQETGDPSHHLEFNQQHSECLAGESQLEDFAETCEIDSSLLCRELVSQSRLSAKSKFASISTLTQKPKEIPVSSSTLCGLSELELLDFDTPPDLIHDELPFGSQESIFDWLDGL
ncbi:hypothetical protein MLD38_022692 [Melastoma candidum]|uniref:Uncharacterized protein n=1 Tax=Melastoma candidum TaxID=119954 RepID=A0ACB9QJZ5_9MYRT|nr:hypothetical protein MLD38_022692 [Melastoma candidum]